VCASPAAEAAAAATRSCRYVGSAGTVDDIVRKSDGPSDLLVEWTQQGAQRQCDVLAGRSRMASRSCCSYRRSCDGLLSDFSQSRACDS
jgi:hypothetical protein